MDAWERWRIVCLAALSVEDIDIYLFGTMITGILLIGLDFSLGYRRIQKTGTAVQSPTRLPAWLNLWEERSALSTETIIAIWILPRRSSQLYKGKLILSTWREHGLCRWVDSRRLGRRPRLNELIMDVGKKGTDVLVSTWQRLDLKYQESSLLLAGSSGGFQASSSSWTDLFMTLMSSSWRSEGPSLPERSHSDSAHSSFSEAEMDMESSSPSWPKETKSATDGGGRKQPSEPEGNWGLRRPLRTVASRQIVIPHLRVGEGGPLAAHCRQWA